MSEWEEFIKEKAPLEGKDPEDFGKEFSYQAEMHYGLKKDEIGSLTKKQLEDMYSDWKVIDDMDHADPESDEPSKLITSWHKDKGLPRRGCVSDS